MDGSFWGQGAHCAHSLAPFMPDFGERGKWSVPCHWSSDGKHKRGKTLVLLRWWAGRRGKKSKVCFLPKSFQGNFLSPSFFFFFFLFSGKLYQDSLVLSGKAGYETATPVLPGTFLSVLLVIRWRCWEILLAPPPHTCQFLRSQNSVLLS